MTKFNVGSAGARRALERQRAAAEAEQRVSTPAPTVATPAEAVRSLGFSDASSFAPAAAAPAVMGQGATGEQVKELQTLLNQHLAQPLKQDGIFGPRTERAVKAFQKQMGLPETGVVDQQTLGALRGTPASLRYAQVDALTSQATDQRINQLAQRDPNLARALDVDGNGLVSAAEVNRNVDAALVAKTVRANAAPAQLIEGLAPGVAQRLHALQSLIGAQRNELPASLIDQLNGDGQLTLAELNNFIERANREARSNPAADRAAKAAENIRDLWVKK